MVPREIDTAYIKKFKAVIEAFVKKGFSFVIVTGGGVTCRQYQKALKEIRKVDSKTLDWMGINVTRLNAELMKLSFAKNVHDKIIIDPENVNVAIKDKIIIGAGWKPGWSTDYVAVKLAIKFKAKTVLNLSDIDYVYNSDPDDHKDAKPLKEISWKEFKGIVGGVWKPGAHLPFDPIASKLASRNKLQVIVMNGRRLANLSQFLANKPFRGTVIY